MAVNNDYAIRFSPEALAGEYRTELARFRKEVEILARTLGQGGVQFDTVFATFVSGTRNGRPVVNIDIAFTEEGAPGLIRASRVVDLENRLLIHRELSFSKPVRSEGFARAILRVSRGLVDSFSLTGITQKASLENAAYSGLRYGGYPTNSRGLDALFVKNENITLTRVQVRSWLALTEAQKRAFVLSPEFAGYKQVLFNQRLELTAPVATPVQRARVFGPVKESSRFLKRRLASEVATANFAAEQVAEAKILRGVSRNQALRSAQRRGLSTPAYAQLTDRVIAYAIDFAAVDANLRASLIERFNKIELDLIAALARIDPASASVPSVRQQRLEALLRQTRVIISEGIETIRNFTLTETRELAKFEAQFTASAINSAIGVEVASVGITPSQINAILSDTLINGAPQREWWARQTTQLTNGFSDAIRTGLLQGETTEMLARRIQGRATGRRTSYRTAAGALRFKSEFVGGLLDGPRRNAVAITRTSVASVANRVREETIKGNSDVTKGSQFISTLDSRTTPICQNFSRLIWDNENNPVGHNEAYPGAPPLHWNCRSTLVPVLKSWEELAGADKKDIARKIDQKEALRKRTQASADGQVPADLTYEGWLNTKPVSQQRDILGRKRYDLWKGGEINISAPRGT